MPANAADVGYLQYRVAGQLPLDSQVILLNVRPDSVGWDCEHTQRELYPAYARAGVTGEVVLIRGLYDWSGTLQRLGVALIPIGVLEEDAIAAAHGKLPVAEDVVSKPYARRRIEEVPAHTA